jgi:hypothetical protein
MGWYHNVPPRSPAKKNKFSRTGLKDAKATKTHEFQKKIHKRGLKELKAGTHPQQWRATAHKGKYSKLGPMGELGDDVICEIGISRIGAQMLNGKIIKELNYTNLFRILRNSVYEPLKQAINAWIDIKVPADTEELRQSMKNALTPSGGSQTNSMPLLIILNTRGIPYASVVNKMPSEAVKHPGNHASSIGRYGATLDDPGAISGWYNWVLLQGRTKARALFNQFIKSDVQNIISPFATQLGLKGSAVYNSARQMFTAVFN